MENLKDSSPGYKILSTPARSPPFRGGCSLIRSVKVDLTLRSDVNTNRMKIARYVQVPPNSGPRTKAGKKEGRSWRGNKRKRAFTGSEDENNEEVELTGL